jgi:transcriptional regulator with XRE-family HTH domain
MGKKGRERPIWLAEKLRQIRQGLGLSQAEFIRHMGLEGRLTKSNISAFERGTHEPSLLTLHAYSEAANVYLEVLVRDDLKLPDKLPALKKHAGVPRPTAKKPGKDAKKM